MRNNIGLSGMFLHIYILVIFTDCMSCGTINDTKTLISDLLSDYNINVRPVANQSQSVNVTIQPYIKSIKEFDEVRGKFSFTGALLVTWNDVNMMWNPTLYGNVFEISLLYPNVWIPELVLASPSDDVKSLGQKWSRIRYMYYGLAYWLPADLIESTCSVYIRNYPFDKHKCITSFISIDYLDYEVQLIAASEEFSLEYYRMNSVWSLEKTEVRVIETSAGSQIDLIVYLSRKSSFVITNVVMPILFLSLLNVFVFLLTPESGERVSYCITILLAITVFMTIVSDMLPRSLEPVPIISFKLMADMIISSLIVFVTVLNLNWYHRDNKTPIPQWLKSVYEKLSCARCSNQKIDPNSVKMKQMNMKDNAQITSNIDSAFEHGPIENNIIRLVETEVTWKKLSIMIDCLAFVFFTFASVASFSIFLVLTAHSTTE